ncbi:hypothetical protein LTR10_021709 [Elasticomyces elasticus]|uniref:Xylanolytic transcriptional activator regulatory domain-containing protein n=1 Tax=Exophiala sideris TaxID=1016849 RepID=A0ABR0JDT0_9EURO|nr:hypothetical protein LTR10_021709 [Elasticomyces elasticus]KAK5062065.1 hypothetical protein LTR69_004422 [Exophiala sideris]
MLTESKDETSVHTIVRDVVLGSNAIPSVNESVESCKVFSSPQKRARRETVIRRSNELDSDNFILPPFVLAKELLDNFFTYVHPLWPILHEPGFRKEFAAAYRDSTQLTTAWRAILNLVFAFGCDYLDMTLKEAFEMAHTFHDRGADLILSVCFEQSTVQIVQALFLLTAHLQSDLKMNKCWLSIGCLVRTAQGLRMNQDPCNWDISLVDQEIRKRLWWGIYCLDRFVSLKQGQSPTLLSENMPPVGVPLTSHTSMTAEDDSMLPELLQRPSPIHLFNAMVQLSHMAEAIPVSTFAATQELAENYISRPDGQLELDEVQLSLQLAQVGEQEAKLAAWRRNLPDHLQREMSGADQDLRRQYLILYLRYLHIRLLIHRHMFSMVVRQGNRKVIMPSPGYLRSMITASVMQCAECATQTVSMITTNEDARAIGPWWCNIQLMFTALGTLLAIHASGNLFPEIDTVAIAASINDASNSMRQLSSVSGLMASCYKYFESLRRRMVKVGRENKPQEDRVAARPSMYVADDSNHETDQLPQDPQANGAANDISISPETDCVGSLDEDWTRLFLEPLLPDFTSDVFNT